MEKNSLGPITPFDQEYRRITEILRNSFEPNRGVPLYLHERKSYFTTTTATVLLALHRIGGLTASQYDEFHNTLLHLRDHGDRSGGFVSRRPEDVPAWDASSEGPTVFATSLAIWALLGTNYRGPRLNEVRNAALWLCNQQRDDDGWGYRRTGDDSSIFFTSFALHAIRLTLRIPSDLMQLSPAQNKRLKDAYTRGLRFIRRLENRRGDTVFWRSPNRQQPGKFVEDATASLCAIWTLFEEHSDDDKLQIAGGVRYLEQDLRRHRDQIWDFGLVAAEPTISDLGAYVVSYTPAFIIPLLRMGHSPFEDLCLAPLRWLEQNRQKNEGWPHHSNYRKGDRRPVSFTTAYALWAIAEWYKRASIDARKRGEAQPAREKALRSRINILVMVVIFSTLFLILTYVHFLRIINATRVLGFTLPPLNSIAEQFFGIIISASAALFVTAAIRVLGQRVLKVVRRLRDLLRALLYGQTA